MMRTSGKRSSTVTRAALSAPSFGLLVTFGLAAFACCPVLALAQVITVDTRTGNVTNPSSGQSTGIDRRFAQVKPTAVPLPKNELDSKSRLELIHSLQSEQGFAMRPFPCGHKGLVLAANGLLEPAGDSYMAVIAAEGLAAKPGERLIITDLKVEKDRIVFALNGGPEGKHRYLRHISLGGNGPMTPIVRDLEEPGGSRLTLTFHEHIPAVNSAEVKSLLAPLISFDVKSPIQAFTDTLPPILRNAVLNHEVLVGMSTEMLIYAKGQPDSKSHEMDGNMPFDEWVYGKPPKDVQFVRVNGNRVIRLEIAKIGKPPQIYTKDVVEGLMRTDGSPLELGAGLENHGPKLGDVQTNPDTQAAGPPPSIANPDEKPESNHRDGVMRPVVYPKPKPETQPGANPDGEPDPSISAPPDTSAQQSPEQPPPAAAQPH